MGISTHILDTALGKPAVGVAISLARRDGNVWTPLRHVHTDEDGRARHLLPDNHTLEAGTFRLRFETAAYFAAQGVPGLYPYVDIVFAIDAPAQHYHIPLLLTPNGYTTYRGS
jgi:5-hydroxyisourate hydrolase